MKPFVFKLKIALDIKLREEELTKEVLQKATKAYRQNLAFLDKLKSRLVEIQDMLRGKQVKTIYVLEVKNYLDYIPVLNDRIKQQENVTEQSRLEMEQIRKKLLEIMKKRKVLEKLKTRHYQEYLKELLLKEQKQIDEMATIGFIHKDSAV